MPIVADNDKGATEQAEQMLDGVRAEFKGATEQAEQMLDGVRAELRDGDRLVIRFSP